jgi:AmpE protein
MSLLSLLIALAAEKSLSSSFWRFDHYYQMYANFFQNNSLLSKHKDSTVIYTLFLLIPVALIYGILSLVDDGLLHFVLSTLVLIVCFGCFTTRSSYKQYLQAANRDEETTSKLYHLQLLQDKNLPPMGFGQALIWLNYRYYIAIMLFFTLFGATGVVFYRLLTTVIEQQNNCPFDQNKEDNPGIVTVSSGCKNYHHILFFLDWLPVRITTFGYMFVGHFSKALPIWLESFFDSKKSAHKILSDVAQKSEDNIVDKNDCTAEPCLLVRLSKRNVLLLLATIAALTLFGVVR